MRIARLRDDYDVKLQLLDVLAGQEEPVAILRTLADEIERAVGKDAERRPDAVPVSSAASLEPVSKPIVVRSTLSPTTVNVPEASTRAVASAPSTAPTSVEAKRLATSRASRQGGRVSSPDTPTGRYRVLEYLEKAQGSCKAADLVGALAGDSDVLKARAWATVSRLVGLGDIERVDRDFLRLPEGRRASIVEGVKTPPMTQEMLDKALGPKTLTPPSASSSNVPA